MMTEFLFFSELTMDCRERKKKENESKKLIVFLIYRSQIVVIEPYLYVLKAADSFLLAPLPCLPALNTLFNLAAFYCSGVIILGLCRVDKVR